MPTASWKSEGRESDVNTLFIMRDTNFRRAGIPSLALSKKPDSCMHTFVAYLPVATLSMRAGACIRAGENAPLHLAKEWSSPPIGALCRTPLTSYLGTLC